MKKIINSIQDFTNCNKIPESQWQNICDKMQKLPYYGYSKIDLVQFVWGFNLYLKEDWKLEVIQLNIKNGEYKNNNIIVKNILPGSSFIFCINGVVFEYLPNQQQLKDIANDITLQICRLAIVEDMENKVFFVKK
jgi:hypothetical protein